MDSAMRYRLTVPDDARGKLAAAWLALGLGALMLAGVLAILLVALRTPVLQTALPIADFFRVALVAHVDLSVLVWFVAFAAMLWTINSTPRALGAGWAALALSAAGTAAIALAPFVGHGQPVMANYIPVLQDPWFLGGLGLVGAGFTLAVLRGLFCSLPVSMNGQAGEGALRFGLIASLVTAAVAVAAFAWSWRAVPAALESTTYYELLFWGGGHSLQFTWTLLMLVAWLWLADAIGARIPLRPRVIAVLFTISLLPALATPAAYLAFDVASVEHHELLTWAMRFGGELTNPLFALAVVWALLRAGPVSPGLRPLRAALVVSIALFCVGGSIGFLIHGTNVKITAHYHGSIVGVTVALMGLAYMALPALGLGSPSTRLATLQPYLYGGGQLLHVTGLLWSGGYGVQRKVAGSEQVLHTAQEIAGMSLMGLGGLIAVAGGVLFVVVMLQAVWRGRAWRSRAVDAVDDGIPNA
jgi:hypothetical protein